MKGRPEATEAAEYYSRYINRVEGDDILGVLATQLDETLALLQGISEEKSLYRYAPDKWSLREMLAHVNDTERVFSFRAFWFARGLPGPLAGFDQDVCAAAVPADQRSWADHLEELRVLRLSTLAFFRGLPAEAWSRGGIASDNPVTVRALAYMIAGHLSHHLAILEERYR